MGRDRKPVSRKNSARGARPGRMGARPANRANFRVERGVAGRTALCHGITRQQHAFLREKILGLNDKEAAIAAGYSPSVAENTKQKIWAKAGVQAEFERLKSVFYAASKQSAEGVGPSAS